MSFRFVLGVLSVWIGLTACAFAGDLDRYRYVLEKSTNDKVCRHMQKVYNRHFSYPFKRPGWTMPRNDPVYGPNGRYAFPKLPGVTHDDRMTSDMSYSRLPTSPEFDAIEWKEGRYRHVTAGQDRGDRPILVAEIDIDNDGRTETVIKGAFMLSYYPAGRAPGGEDKLFVFEKGEINVGESITFEMLFAGHSGRKNPSLIGEWSGAPYRIIRPFVLEGVTYLSGYQPDWIDEFTVKREYMDVVRYRSGGENLGPDKIGSEKWSPLNLDSICRFRMSVVKQR